MTCMLRFKNETLENYFKERLEIENKNMQQLLMITEMVF